MSIICCAAGRFAGACLVRSPGRARRRSERPPCAPATARTRRSVIGRSRSDAVGVCVRSCDARRVMPSTCRRYSNGSMSPMTDRWASASSGWSRSCARCARRTAARGTASRRSPRSARSCSRRPTRCSRRSRAVSRRTSARSSATSSSRPSSWRRSARKPATSPSPTPSTPSATSSSAAIRTSSRGSAGRRRR